SARRRLGGWRPRVGLRLMLLVALLPLLGLPWIGLRFVEQMAELARDERLENLVVAARNLATSLHERPELFAAASGSAAGPPDSEPITLDLLGPARVDGDAGEWVEVARRALPVAISGDAPRDTLAPRIAVARSQEHPGKVFVLAEVVDERYVAPDAQGPGDRMQVFHGDDPDAMQAVVGTAVARQGGWIAEAEVPESMLLRVLIEDVDYLGSRRLEATADSGLLALSRPPGDKADEARERQWALTIGALSRASGRVAVYDVAGVQMARQGSLANPEQPDRGWSSQLARWLLAAASRLRPEIDTINVVDTGHGSDQSRAAVSALAKALTGVPAQQWLRTGLVGGMPVWLLTVAQPVWSGDRVVGALVIEESTGSRLALGQQALERLTLLAAVALAGTVVALLLVATITVARIVRLRRAAESAIDARGRVVGTIPEFRMRDEVGELAIGYERVLARLREHQEYLSKLRGRLVHELRTPIMVVRSSLDNLAAEADPVRQAAYAERAQQGAARLERIVASMGEASSLETMLGDSQLEQVDLARLVASCVDAYRGAYPAAVFELARPGGAAHAEVVPEAIAQALDKLVANAVDFAVPGTTIRVELVACELADPTGGRRPVAGWRLSVFNLGQPLPESMGDSLFDSMVSVRDSRSASSSHLGLGLFLVRLIAEFHGGQVFAEDEAGGVRVGFTMPAVA
ncbi:MAG: ATP-binding protein, partial [Burkholderiaceae bacterium]|nr:ATP-binding protein [Burkholderiaceae bacterium]